MKKEDLIDIYMTYSLKETCFMLGCSAPTLYKRLKEYGIQRKGQGRGKRKRRKLIIED